MEASTATPWWPTCDRRLDTTRSSSALGGHGELVRTPARAAPGAGPGVLGGAARARERAHRPVGRVPAPVQSRLTSYRSSRSGVSRGGGRAAYRNYVAKTKTRTSGRVGNRFWKLLGASTERDQARSMAQVDAASEFDEKAADLDDEQLRKAAKLLNLKDLAESDDIPQFLAIAREASERATTLRPFDVQLQRRAADARRRRRRDGDRRGQDAGRRDRRRRATRSAAAACTSSPSTTTWPAATPSGWARSTRRWG